MNPKSFRALVSLSIALLVAAASVDLVFPHLLSSSLALAVEGEPVSSLFETSLGLALVGSWLTGTLVGVVGLFFFRSWARTLTFWLTALGFALYPALGSTVSSWLAAALTEAAAITWGAMLAFAYSEPVSSKFRGQPHDA
jgi:hypothetical protein